MPINEWFDIGDPAHLRAWKHLQATGKWPEGFVPETVTFPPSWQALIINAMAEAWVSHALRGQEG